jgi:F420-non-reducing hydrogenase iron-sulfur subunit
LIRVMCSGRVDLSFVLRAFTNGMDGVFIGGCHLNECHYITDGNHHAYSMVQLCKKLLACMGLNPDRLKIEQLSAGEGIRFAEFMNEFSERLHVIGPLGKAEGVDRGKLLSRLKAASRLVPNIRLVERERLRIHLNSAEEYERYFRREDVARLIQELIADKIAISQIMDLLREQPRSTGELAEILGIAPMELAKYMSHSTRQGLTRFDEIRKRFIAA